MKLRKDDLGDCGLDPLAGLGFTWKMEMSGQSYLWPDPLRQLSKWAPASSLVPFSLSLSATAVVLELCLSSPCSRASSTDIADWRLVDTFVWKVVLKL